MPSEYCYPHKDSAKIENVTQETLEKVKTFKGAKFIGSAFPNKKNAVRQATDATYHPHKGQEEV